MEFYFMGIKFGKTKSGKEWYRATIFDYTNQVSSQVFVNKNVVDSLELEDMEPYTEISDHVAFQPVSINNNVYYALIIKN